MIVILELDAYSGSGYLEQNKSAHLDETQLELKKKKILFKFFF